MATKTPKNAAPATAATTVVVTAPATEGSSNQANDAQDHDASQDAAGSISQDTEAGSQNDPERVVEAGSAIRPTPQAAELAAGVDLDPEEFRKRYPALSAAFQARFEADLPAPRAIRITSKQEGFRRGNMEHSMTPTEHDQGVFTSPEQLELIFAEPMLVVELI